jgi:hypothetical protein
MIALLREGIAIPGYPPVSASQSNRVLVTVSAVDVSQSRTLAQVPLQGILHSTCRSSRDSSDPHA